MSEFEGGCMCGAVQYAVKSEPRLSFYANAGSVNESTSQVIRPNLLHRQKNTIRMGAPKFSDPDQQTQRFFFGQSDGTKA